MGNFSFRSKKDSATLFRYDSSTGMQLLQLFGIPCDNHANSRWIKGLISLDTDQETLLFEKDARYSMEKHQNGFTATFIRAGLMLKSTWIFCEITGVWSRKDTLQNVGTDSIAISRCLPRFSLIPGSYQLYSQSSRWCHESHGEWQNLSHGGFVLNGEGGRTTQGSTPYLCILNQGTGKGIVFHVLPEGNWIIKVSMRTAPGDSMPIAVIESGLSDEHLHYCLNPGDTLELPEILIQELFDGQPQRSASRLHEYMLLRENDRRPSRIPVVYNTWFDAFDDLNTERLDLQLAAAKEAGCEVFTVDAGWYGALEGNWFFQNGDWREKPNGAFYGRMKAFSDKVRATGLGFGLWMEPERISSQAPVFKGHPDWFIDADNGYYYPDLCKENVCGYIQSEICRLIDTYELEWIKLDFNFDLGVDPYKVEFTWYYAALYRMMDQIRHKYPGLFVEGCSSGGMRLELMSVGHFDAHFMSDTAYPADMLEIFEGSLLRLMPGHLSKWAVMRQAGKVVPVYGKPLQESPETLLVPYGATWEISQSAYLDFILFSAMPGVLGLGGDIAGLSGFAKSRLAELVDFYKKHRISLYQSTAEILAHSCGTNGNHDWKVVQMMPREREEAVIFAYRLNDPRDTYTIKPLNLMDSKFYHVEYWDGKSIAETILGEILMDQGITVGISERCNATAVVVTQLV